MKNLSYFLILALTANYALARDVSVTLNNGRAIVSGPASQLSEEMTELIHYKKSIDGKTVAATAIKNNQADVTDLLTDKMKALNGQNWLNGVGGYGNCHGEASYFAGLSPILAHDEGSLNVDYSRRSSYWFNDGAPEACQDVEYKDLKSGDIGVIINTADDGNNIHSFTVLSKNLVFSKNGHNGLNIPYAVRSLSEIADTYFTFNLTEEPNSEKINYYREGLKQGFDCVRGTREEKRSCVDNEYPLVFFHRCKSIEALETEHRSALTSEYTQARETIWSTLQALSQNDSNVLQPQPLPASYQKAAALAASKAEEDLGPVQNFFWTQLSGVVHNANAYLNVETEVRKAIFPEKP